MLQRIQTVYLTIVFIFTMLAVLLPLGNFDFDGVNSALKITGLELPANAPSELRPGWQSIALSVLCFVIMGLTVYTVFQYKRRRFQIQLGKVIVLLHMVLVFSAFYYIDFYTEKLSGAAFSHSLAIYLPLISMILVIVANKAIKKDEELVQSADRIR